MDPKLDELDIVHMKPEHEAYVCFSWIDTMLRDLEIARRQRQRFYKLHHRVVDRVLQKSTVMVATMKGDPNIIFGYLVTSESIDPPIVHFLFVKPLFRGLGVGRTLVRARNWDLNKCFYTHHVNGIDCFLSKFPGLKYYPHLV